MFDRPEHNQSRSKENNEPETKVSLRSVNWSRLFSYLKPYRGRMSLAILALLISSVFGLAFPLVIVRLLDSVTKAKDFGPLNLLGRRSGCYLFIAGRLQFFTILSAVVYRRTHSLRFADQTYINICTTYRSISSLFDWLGIWFPDCPATLPRCGPY